MGSYLTHTVSGTNIVQVKTIEESPIENLKIHFLPKQEGSGTPAPDNVRDITGVTGVNVWLTGKNLLNVNRTEGTPNSSALLETPRVMDESHYYVGLQSSNYYYHDYADGSVQNGVVRVTSNANNSYGIGFPVAVKGGQKYTLNANAEKVLISFGAYDAEWNYLSEIPFTTSLPTTITMPQGATYCVIVFRSQVNEQYTYSEIQFEVGETATNYEAYHADTLSLSSLYVRKNLFDPTKCNKTASNNIRPYYDQPITLYPGTYTMSCDEQCNGIQVNEEQTALFTAYHATSLTFTLSAAKTVWFNFYKEGGFAADTTVQLEIGDTATTHVSYNALSPFQNTIYGGYIDFATGNIYAEYAEVLNTTWSNTTATEAFTNVERRSFAIAEDNLVLPNTGSTGKYCNVATWSWNWTGDTVHFYTDPDTRTAIVFLPLNTAEDTHIQIVQPYINPVLIGQIVPISFKTKAGIMNISSDVTNTIECTYRFTDHLMQRRILIDAPHITTSTSAAGFETNMRANIPELKIEFSPYQAGSGMACMPGKGKNLFNPESTDNTFINTNYEVYEQPGAKTVRIPASEGQKYYLSIKETTSSGVLMLAYLDSSDNVLSRVGLSAAQFTQVGLVAPANTATLVASVTVWDEASEVQLELNNTGATEYVPYTNIRNITGTSSINLTHSDTNSEHSNVYNIALPVLGDNLFDKSTGLELQTKNLRVARNQGAGKGVPFLMKAGVTYTVYCNSATDPTEIYLLEPYTTTIIKKEQNSSSLTYTPEEDIEVGINMYWYLIDRPADATDIMIKIGSTKTNFHPYFKIADGYINLITGELVVNSILLTYNTANMNNLEGYPGWKGSGIQEIVGTQLDKIYYHKILNIGDVFAVNTKYSDILFLPKSSYGLTQTEWQALAMDIQLCVPYTTPQVIQLTPQQIKSFVGENNYTTNLINPTITTKYWTH